MLEQFEDRVAVITGAGSGIGGALVERAVAEGMRVVAFDIDEAGLAAAPADAGGSDAVMTSLTDVADGALLRCELAPVAPVD